jgi:peroxiredoxin
MRSRAAVVLFVLALLAVSAPAFAQTEAETAFKNLMNDLQMKSKMMSPYEYSNEAERSLLGFISKYPKAPEAADAHVLLGRLYSSIGASEAAIRQFNEYLKTPGKKGANEIAQANYLIGANYMVMEKYDEAEKAYREAVKEGVGIDPRIKDAASADLARIAALRKLKIGEPAVEISASTHDGKKIRLKDYRGKVVLLDFWAAWCNPCRIEMPNVIKVYNEFRNRGFEIIGVSLDRDETQFRNFIKENKMTWPEIYDGQAWGSSVGQLYAVNSIPATFLIDRQGKIRFKNVRGEQLRQAVQQLINEK